MTIVQGLKFVVSQDYINSIDFMVSFSLQSKFNLNLYQQQIYHVPVYKKTNLRNRNLYIGFQR